MVLNAVKPTRWTITDPLPPAVFLLCSLLTAPVPRPEYSPVCLTMWWLYVQSEHHVRERGTGQVVSFFYTPNCKSGFPPHLRVVENNPTSVGRVMEGSGCCHDPLASIVCYIRCLIVVPHTQYSLSLQGLCMGPVLTPRPEIDINILN